MPGFFIDPWSGEEFPRMHVPLVTPEEFARVQRVVNGRRRSVAYQREREEFHCAALPGAMDVAKDLRPHFARPAANPYYLVSTGNAQTEAKARSLSLNSRKAVIDLEVFSFPALKTARLASPTANRARRGH
jgi:hypothetical protein